MNLFPASSSCPWSFLEVPPVKAERGWVSYPTQASFPWPIPIKGLLFRGKRVQFLGLPQLGSLVALERKAWSRKVLSERGPSESLGSE